jgi:hypothetical protein
MTEIFAIDIGFGWTKVVTIRNRLLLPSLVGPAESIRFQSDVVENSQGIAVEVDDLQLFVGEQAELQSASARQTLDVSRTGSSEQKALFYAACSELVRTNDTEIAVVTGLPVGDFNDTNKQKLRDTYGLDWTLHLSKVDRAVRQGQVEIQGRPVEIGGLVKHHFDAIADTITAHARTLWGTGLELKAIVVTGGGSYKLVPYIARAFPHTRTAGSDPQFSNVIGYLRAGLRRFG